MTDEQMRDLVKDCGLDWQRGYMPLFDGDPTNRYAVLISAVPAAERERICAAIKAEDDYMVDRDYMLDSDDCISVARGQWKRPE